MAIGADFTRSLLLEAGIGPGMRVLDVGCGSGEVAFEVARLVGETGEVIGVDRSDRALDVARSQSKELGLAQVVFASVDIAAVPFEMGFFDAIVGRRVLMYLPDPAVAVATLAARLRPGGTMAFHEHDMSRPPNAHPMPVHDAAMRWIREAVLAEGAEPNMGFRLHEVLAGAGLSVCGVRVAANVQTPSQPYPLAELVSTMRRRILAAKLASDEEIDSLFALLAAERAKGTWLADLMFGAWARKPVGRASA